MKNKKGISLIVLIITIIVVIILAAVVILTLSKNNPIESAKEARFKEDVRTFQDELALTVSKQYTIAGGHRDKKITTSNFDEIKELIPSFSEKYRDKFIIQDDELIYTNKLDEKEKEYAQSLNVNKRNSILPDEYQQVEYIESTGTQWIDTEFIPNNFKTLKIKYVSEVPEAPNYIIGFFCNGNYYGLRRGKEGGNNGMRWHSPKGVFDIDYTPESNKFFEIVQDSENLYINGILFEGKKVQNVSQLVNQKSLYIFARNDNGTPRLFSSVKLKNISIEHEGKIIRDYIPVLDCNQKIGLYDTIEGKFYTNQGTGEDFRAGPAVD